MRLFPHLCNYYHTKPKPIMKYADSILFFFILRMKIPPIFCHKDDKMISVNDFVHLVL